MRRLLRGDLTKMRPARKGSTPVRDDALNYVGHGTKISADVRYGWDPVFGPTPGACRARVPGADTPCPCRTAEPLPNLRVVAMLSVARALSPERREGERHDYRSPSPCLRS